VQVIWIDNFKNPGLRIGLCNDLVKQQHAGSAIHHCFICFLGMNCIFIGMKASAYIFSAIFLLVFGLLHLQPLFGNRGVKEEQSCAKTKCQKQKPVGEKKDCPGEEKGCPIAACNPFVPCAMSSCCYVVENFFSHNPFSIIKKQKLALFDDNTLQTTLSECWHPPEVIS
jgi:hypothetical protein